MNKMKSRGIYMWGGRGCGSNTAHFILSVVAIGIAWFMMYDASHETKSTVDNWCFMKNCAVKILPCLSDAQCRQVMDCIRNCTEDDFDCQQVCSMTYESAVFDTFTQCLWENSCMKTFERVPQPQTRYRAPKFTIDDFVGVWYVAAGYSKPIDCYDCTRAKIRRSETNESLYEDTMTIQFPTHSRTIYTNLTLHSPSVIKASYRMSAIDGYDYWDVLYNNDGYLCVYYTGENNFNTYRGVYVFSRNTGGLNETAEHHLREVLEEANINITYDDLCMLDTTHSMCDYHNDT